MRISKLKKIKDLIIILILITLWINMYTSKSKFLIEDTIVTGILYHGK